MARPAAPVNPSPPPSPPGTGGPCWRPLTPHDVPAWHAAWSRAAAVDRPQEHVSAEDLHDELSADGFDPARDSLAAFDDAGTVLAWGTVSLPPGDHDLLRVACDGEVDPDLRGRGIGRRLLRWQLAVAADRVARRREELGRHVPARVQAVVEEQRGDRRALLTRHGLLPLRWFTSMQRDLAGFRAGPHALPDGLELRPWDPALDEAVRTAHNEVFRDHWGSQPVGPGHWRQAVTGNRHFRPGWSFVVCDATGAVAGYALSSAYEEDWAAQGYTQGWTDLVGVVRSWRGRGLAGALLHATAGAFARDGVQTAGLGVDTENPTGALRLYSALGYRPRHRSVLHAAALP